MSATTSLAVVALAVAGVMYSAREQRQPDLEDDAVIQRKVEDAVRLNAHDYNPQVSLTPPVLDGFELVSVQVTRPGIRTLFQSVLGPDCDVYVRYREGGSTRCMTLDLRWIQSSDDWKVVHPGVIDRCKPSW